MENTIIKLENIGKIYVSGGLNTIALHDINMNIENGEFIAIAGPSGCGKTTLLNILGLIDAPNSGCQSFMGEQLMEYSEAQRDKLRKGRIGFIFQSFNLIDELSVFENVELPLKYLGIKKSERKRKTLEILTQLRINHRSDYYPHQLSGGQQQLVAIARAIVINPTLLLADEPTGNIDSVMGERIMETLCNLNEQNGTTIIMATHNERDASFAHRIINMYDGTTVAITQNKG